MTDARVEVVARALERAMFAPHELPIEGWLRVKYEETASAVVTALDAHDREVAGAVRDQVDAPSDATP